MANDQAQTPAWHPNYLSAIRAYPKEYLIGEIDRVSNSVLHLERSNSELLTAAQETGDDSLREVAQENKQVIKNQNDRLEMLNGELKSRIA